MACGRIPPGDQDTAEQHQPESDAAELGRLFPEAVRIAEHQDQRDPTVRRAEKIHLKEDERIELIIGDRRANNTAAPRPARRDWRGKKRSNDGPTSQRLTGFATDEPAALARESGRARTIKTDPWRPRERGRGQFNFSSRLTRDQICHSFSVYARRCAMLNEDWTHFFFPIT